jgi:hypothetical protein
VFLCIGIIAQRGGNNIIYRHGRDFARNCVEACLCTGPGYSTPAGQRSVGGLQLGSVPLVDRLHGQMFTVSWNNLLVDRPMTTATNAPRTTVITGTLPNQTELEKICLKFFYFYFFFSFSGQLRPR